MIFKIELITNNKSITQHKIADIMGVNVRTIKRNFKVLIDNSINFKKLINKVLKDYLLKMIYS